MESYQLIRSNRKTISLELSDSLQPVVRAPQRMSRREIDRFVKKNEKWIEKQRKRRIEYRENHPPLGPEEERVLIQRARDYLPSRVEFYSERMGLFPTGVKITKAQKRFGSCSGKNSLCFSYRLMEYPLDAIDYVVVHELAHIPYKNHDAEFYHLIESILPDYKRRRDLLKR